MDPSLRWEVINMEIKPEINIEARADFSEQIVLNDLKAFIRKSFATVNPGLNICITGI